MSWKNSSDVFSREALPMKPKVLVIAGPTASGKTSLGIRLAKALNGEIVSADSMQVYRSMPIATAQPTAEEMQGIPHHLMAFLAPCEPFSVARFQSLALACIHEILSRGKVPILVGGTGLYIDAVVRNTQFLDCEPTPLREKLDADLASLGADAMLQRLREVDPETAASLHVNDSKRILRALELYETTGSTMSQQRAGSHTQESPYSFCKLLLCAEDRAILYQRIEQRVDQMLEQGLLQEAEAFFKLENTSTAKQAIGYKELKPYFDGECSLETAVERLKMETRRYCKRQLTWFRRYDDFFCLPIDRMEPQELFETALLHCQTFLGEQT